MAKWRGVPLAEILERARIRRDAVDVMPQGLDPDYVTGGVDYGQVRRPLPIAKAFKDAILAYEMNGEPLPPDNGFPVRLIVPGCVGIANIKWVGQIQVTKQPRRSRAHSSWRSTPPSHQPQILTGAHGQDEPRSNAWTSAPTDGANWQPARLRHRNAHHAWVRWEYPWQPPGPGPYTLQARATDPAPDRGGCRWQVRLAQLCGSGI